ncbi:hypothetical protein EON65_44485 [archaeon]|nr:MAG: hypothetical protein EON65_44485 [archaeon]
MYSQSSSGRYQALQKPLVLVFSKVDLERNLKGYNYLANRVRKVATQYKDQYVFAIAHVLDYMYELDKQYGVAAATDKNTYVGIKHGDTYYTMTDTFSLDNFSDFLKRFSAGQVEGKVHTPRRTSEEDSEGGSFYEGTDVVTLTQENFASEVTSSNADVLVEFYAPWCGHCKHLKPEFIEAAETLAKV